MFAGTLFARGDVNSYAFLDELWFESAEDALALNADPDVHTIFTAGRALLNAENSFAMITTERVVADFVTDGEMTPRPASLTPGSFEARLAAQGGEGWNIPSPANRRAVTPCAA
jgi:hypothetical protein